MAKLIPLPGRILLEFKPPAEKSAGGIIIPDTSKQRVEIGTVLAIGDATNDREKIIAANIKKGDKLPVTYGAGVCFWKKDYSASDEWLKDLRVFTIAEVAAKVED